MDVTRLDWNLVPVLDALLTEQNVSRAARRLGITQPAASRALARLRRLYDDELLVRRGNTYELTPLARSIRPVARRAVVATRQAVEPGAGVDPTTLVRAFTVAASDYTQVLFMPRLRDALLAAAPDVRVNFVQPFAVASTDVEVLPNVDGWIAPREVFDDRPHVGSQLDEWVCVTDVDNPLSASGIQMSDLTSQSWVVPTVSGRTLSLQMLGLRAHGVDIRVAMTTDSFVAVPFLVQNTLSIGLTQRGVAQQFADIAGIRVHACPWAVAPIELTFWYDALRENDAPHRWFRELVASAMGPPR
jgi:DNA-binding transcriptional LysR family regulator